MKHMKKRLLALALAVSLLCGEALPAAAAETGVSVEETAETEDGSGTVEEGTAAEPSQEDGSGAEETGEPSDGQETDSGNGDTGEPSDGQETDSGNGDTGEPSDGQETDSGDGGDTGEPSDGQETDSGDSGDTGEAGEPSDGQETDGGDSGEAGEPSDGQETDSPDDGDSGETEEPSDAQETEPAESETEDGEISEEATATETDPGNYGISMASDTAEEDGVVASGVCGADEEEDNLTWSLDSEGVLTISGTGGMADYSHDSAPWYDYREEMTSLVIEKGVTSIGDYAFYSGVYGVDDYGFTGSLSIPESVTSIGKYAFNGCEGFTGGLTIPDSVTTIGDSAFSGCEGFTGGLTIGNGVESIGDSAFRFCSGFTGSLSIPESMTSIGDYAFYWCHGFTGSLSIPDGVTSIGDYAFYYCGFTGNLTIPDGVTSIGDYAFYWCYGFKGSLTIGDGVTSIGDYAFYRCYGFTESLAIPDSVTSIGDYAFDGCYSLTSLTIGSGVTSIGDYAFDGCYSLTSLTIGSGVTSIGDYAFDGCDGLTDIYYQGDGKGWQSIAIGEINDPLLYSGTIHYQVGEVEGNYTITFEANGGRAISPISLASGSTINLSDYAPTKKGYNFLGWHLDTELDEAVTEHTLTGNIMVYAKWEEGAVASGYCGGEDGGETLTWSLDLNGTLTIGGTGAMADYTYGSAPWYGYRGEMTSLVIEEGVTSIGDYAFYYCGFTGNLTIPESVTSIGDSAFRFCSGFTGSLSIPESVTSIGKDAFNGCEGFTGSLSIPEGVTSIGDYAFNGCEGFTGSLSIPEGVTSIGDYAFNECEGFTGSLSIPEGVTSIGNYAFQSCSGFTGDLAIGEGVTSIGKYAFSGCSGFAGSLTIPASVASIGACAFYGCSGFTDIYYQGDGGQWQSIVLGEMNDPLLYSGTIHYQVGEGEEGYTITFETDGGRPISPISLASGSTINLSDYVPAKEDYNFLGWHSDATLSNEVTETTLTGDITVYAKWEGGAVASSGYCGAEEDGTNLTWSLDSDGVLTISGTGDMADYTQSSSAPWYGYREEMTSLVIEEGVTEIGVYAFYNCSGFTGSLSIPEGVTEIGGCAFSGCSGFTGDLAIPGGVTEIGGYAFYNCSGFTGSLSIPEGVTEIGGSAFSGCSGFTGSLIIPDSVTSIGSSAFSGCSSFTGSLTIPEGVASIGDYAFSGCSGFTGSLTIPEGIASIGSGAFQSCRGLTGSLTIPASVTSIGSSAFSGCSGFTGGLTIPASVTSIGASAFSGCRGFTGGLTIPDGVTRIEEWTFRNCSGLTGSLIIPEGVTSIGDQAFNNCSGFTGDITIPDGVTSIGKWAFQSCSGLTGSLTIPASVTAIGYSAFNGCDGFTSLTIGSGVTSIGDYAFNGCDGFTDIHYQGDGAGWQSIEIGSGNDPLLYSGTIHYNVHADGEEACDITFETNGGRAIAPISVDSGSTINLSDYAPAKKGYSFVGWHLDAGLTEAVTGRTLTGDITVYAKWEELVDVLYSGYCGAEDDGTNLTWSLDSKGALTISGTGAMEDYSSYTTAPWYDYREGMTSLVIEEGVTGIGNYAFYNCSGFTGDLAIPEGVTEIGAYAFYNCSGFTGDLAIPEGVTEIGAYAFYNCSGFAGSLAIPASVTSIGDYAFYGCSGFTDVYYQGSGEQWEAIEIGANNGPLDSAAIHYRASYTVTFETGGGTAIEAVAVDGGSTVDLSAYAPTREGYSFGGWHLDAGLTEAVTELTPTGDVTVYAKWGERLESLIGKAASGGKVTLTQDYALEETLEIAKGIEINLNGHTISVACGGDSHCHEDQIHAIKAVEGGRLTLTDSAMTGGVANCQGAALWAEGGEIIIYGGAYKTYGTYDEDGAAHPTVCASADDEGNAGTVSIHGGSFQGEGDGDGQCCALAQEGGVTAQAILVYGGSFKNFDPSQGDAGAGVATFLAGSGYKVTQDPENPGEDEDVWYTVKASEGQELADLVSANSTGTVTLEKDYELESPLVINKEVTIDLNGHAISVACDGGDLTDGHGHTGSRTDDGDGTDDEIIDAIRVDTGGALTLTDSAGGGGVENCRGIALWARGGEIIIKGGHYETYGAHSGDGESAFETVYASAYGDAAGTISVYGGTFQGQKDEGHGAYFALNQHDSLTSQAIYVYGGSFCNFDPSKGDVYSSTVTTFLASAGYKVTSETEGADTWYTVYASEGQALANLIAEADAGTTVTLTQDYELESGLEISKEIEIDLNGHTISVACEGGETVSGNSASGHYHTGDRTDDGDDTDDEIIDAIRVEKGGRLTLTDGAGGGGVENCRGIALWARGGEIIIKGGHYETYGSHSGDGKSAFETVYASAYGDAAGKISIYGGTFQGQKDEGHGAYFALNQQDSITGQAIFVYGGSFKNFDPSKGDANANVSAFLADGYGVTAGRADAEGNVWYTVDTKKSMDDADYVQAIAPLRQDYTGSEITPGVTVLYKDADGLWNEMAGSEYSVAYAGNTSVGTATATVTAAEGGNFTGYATVSFTIGTTAAYTVKYNKNNGTGYAPANQTFSTSDNLEGVTIATVGNLKRTGYGFAGWNTKANGSGNAYEAGASVALLGNETGTTITLYAQWEAIEYTVTLDHAYKVHTEAVNNVTWTQTYDVTAAITLPTPTRAGYTFGGWYSYTADEDTGEYTLTGSKVTKISKGSTGDMELAASWTANAYKITFNKNGGTGSMDALEYTYDPESTGKLTANAFERAGYEFTGWDTAAKGTGTDFKDQADLKGLAGLSSTKVTLYAQWEAVGYPISYSLHGGENHEGNPDVYTASAKVSLKNPTRAGYKFDGWYTSYDAEADTYSGKTASLSYNKNADSHDVELYAKWSLVTYTVTFNKNGGAGSMDKMSFAYEDSSDESYDPYGETLTKNAFTRTGYEFTGWDTKAKGTGNSYKDGDDCWLLGEESSTTGKITLYAQWEAVGYPISYNLDGGKNHEDNPEVYDASAKVSLKNPTKAGYKFIGWHTDADFSGKKVTSLSYSAYGEEGVELYAKFEALSYTITFNKNGGANGPDGAMGKQAFAYCEYDGTGEGYKVTDDALEKNTFERKGYAFAGWNTRANGTGNSYADGAACSQLGEETTSTGKITLYAQWKAIDYTISLDYGYQEKDGEGNSADKKYSFTYTVATATQTLTTPTRDGYSFKGWFKYDTDTAGNKTATGSKIAKISKGSTGDLDLMAVWEQKTYTVSFNKNGGTGSIAAMETYTYDAADTDKKLTSNNGQITRTGYKFTGWDTKANGSGTAFEDNAAMTGLGGLPAGKVTLYAQWEAITYSVEYDLGGGTNSAKNPGQWTVAKTATLTDPTRTGWDFAGWTYTISNGDSGTGEAATVSGEGTALTSKKLAASLVESHGEGSTIKLTAAWTEKEYKITFNKNYTDSSVAAQTKSFDSKTAKTDGADGYDTELGDDALFVVNQNPARTQKSADGYGYESIREGYVFTGWNTKANGTGSSYKSGSKLMALAAEGKSKITLYAQWGQVVYGIELKNITEGNKATGGNDKYPEEYAIYVNEDTDSAAPASDEDGDTGIESKNKVYISAPVKDGYGFKGWHTSKGFKAGTGLASETVSVSTGTEGTPAAIDDASGTGSGGTQTYWYFDRTDAEDKTLYPKWEIETYNIAYELDGGTNSGRNKASYTIASSAYLYSPTKSGYSFEGWYTDSALTTEFTESRVSYDSNREDHNVTLYAKWEKSAFSISYELNGAEENSAKNPTTYTATSSSKLYDIEREGYAFNGWLIKTTSNNYYTVTKIVKATAYTEEDVKVSLAGDITLYASWIEK